MSKRQWTPEQSKAIETVGTNVLVSAAAGSGKTSVLAERCAHLVCDANPKCDVDELLVVTFTEAAAAEMRARIHQALRARATTREDAHLQRQLVLIDQASISTLHAFCARVLRQHYTRVGLDPNFKLLDEHEARLLRRDVVDKLFDDSYELPDNGRFLRLVDDYGDGDDRQLRRKVVEIYELLTSVVDPVGWRQTSLMRLREAAEKPLAESELGQKQIRLVDQALESLLAQARSAWKTVHGLKTFQGYEDVIKDCGNFIRHMQDTMKVHGIDALLEVINFEFPRLPSVKNDVPNKELAKGLVDDLRKAMTEGEWRKSLQGEQGLRDGVASIIDPAEELLALVDAFSERYRASRHAQNVLDFSDLERLTYQVLSDNGRPTRIARTYQQRYAHLLVDEYQDINELQDAILQLVSRQTEHRSLFSVGDVKQSIYRFRLAEPALFLKRQSDYRKSSQAGTVIDLQANFRSREPLLGAINGVFARLMRQDAVDIEYDQTQRLKAGKVYPQGGFRGAPIELHLLPPTIEAPADSDTEAAELDRTQREAHLLAGKIQELMGQRDKPRAQLLDRTDTLRPIEYRDIAVLLRSLKFKAQAFASILRDAGIPAHHTSGTGFFEAQEIRDVLAVLNLLDNQNQDIPLAAVLRSPLVQLPAAAEALARVRVAYPEAPFHRAVYTYAETQQDALAGHLKAFVAQLTTWRQAAQRETVADVLTRIYDQTKYLTYVSGLQSGQQRVANLLELQDHARRFATFERQGVSRFMEFINQLEQETDLDTPSVESEADNTVRIMSIHASKGLEFPVVCLPDMGKMINLSDANGSILAERTTGIAMHVADPERRVRYPSLASSLVHRRIKQQSLAEELRVLYVAMTRAREHLVLIGTARNDCPEKWRSRWGGWTGPLPPEAILGARNMLDWLGPVWAATEKSAQPIFELIQHDEASVSAWASQKAQRPKYSELQERLSRLEPIIPEPPADSNAAEVIDQIGFIYPHQPLTLVSATQSVTRLAKPILHDRQSPPPTHAPPDSLPLPALMLEKAIEKDAIKGVDIGTATHLLLQHLDFAKAASQEQIDRQIELLVSQRLLLPTQDKLVDRDAVLWFVNSDVGRLIRDNIAHLRREIPVNYVVGVPGMPSNNAFDQILVRGRLDLLIPLASGQVIIDYKTDRVDGDALQHRIDTYRGQMLAYRQAIERITRRPVTDVFLVFLHARQIEQV